jgi:Flp pilus assembly pilin Flp
MDGGIDVEDDVADPPRNIPTTSGSNRYSTGHSSMSTGGPMERLRSFWNDESGQGLTGYAVIFVLVAVALLLVLVAFGDEIARVLNTIKQDIRRRPRLG